jgi:hypothetical protein
MKVVIQRQDIERNPSNIPKNRPGTAKNEDLTEGVTEPPEEQVQEQPQSQVENQGCLIYNCPAFYSSSKPERPQERKG